MIYLRNVSKYHMDGELGHEVVLRNVSCVLPTDRPLAVLGDDPRVISTILLMLSGSKVPDRGEVDRRRVRSSPVINAGGGPSILIGQLSALDNVRMLSEFYGVDANKLMSLVEAAGTFAVHFNLPVRRLDATARRSLEVAAVAALPFDCYLADRLHMVDKALVQKLFFAAKARGAGVIFSTKRLPQAARFAKSGVFASNGRLRWAENLQETLASHGEGR